MSTKRPVCGRCGVYQELHPTKACTKPRHMYWIDHHMLSQHIAAWVWIHALTPKMRWRIGVWMDRPDRCWCDITMSCYRADDWATYKGDYSSGGACLCDFQLPWNAGKPVSCYCSPYKTEEATK